MMHFQRTNERIVDVVIVILMNCKHIFIAANYLQSECNLIFKTGLSSAKTSLKGQTLYEMK